MKVEPSVARESRILFVKGTVVRDVKDEEGGWVGWWSEVKVRSSRARALSPPHPMRGPTRHRPVRLILKPIKQSFRTCGIGEHSLRAGEKNGVDWLHRSVNFMPVLSFSPKMVSIAKTDRDTQNWRNDYGLFDYSNGESMCRVYVCTSTLVLMSGMRVRLVRCHRGSSPVVENDLKAKRVDADIEGRDGKFRCRGEVEEIRPEVLIGVGRDKPIVAAAEQEDQA